MPTTVLTRGIAFAGLVLLGVATAIKAQAPSPSTDAGIPALLAEVRALRAEVNQAAGASMRMQLLLARLTLQEQRITSIGRQAVEVQDKLRTATRERSETQGRLREIEDVRSSGRLSVEDERQFAHEAKLISRRLAEHSAREQQLRGEESELLATLAAEQGRWVDFNAKLDELERSFPPAR